MSSDRVSVSSLEPGPAWLLEASSDLLDSNELLFPESVDVSDVPSVGMSLSEKVSLRSVMLSSAGLSSPVVDRSVPGSNSASHPLDSTGDGVLVSVSEGVVVWSLEALSDLSNSLNLLSPESVHVSDLPLVVEDVSVVVSLGSVVSSS